MYVPLLLYQSCHLKSLDNFLCRFSWNKGICKSTYFLHISLHLVLNLNKFFINNVLCYIWMLASLFFFYTINRLCYWLPLFTILEFLIFIQQLFFNFYKTKSLKKLKWTQNRKKYKPCLMYNYLEFLKN